MAEDSPRRTIFGRLLTAFGFVWIIWALFGELVTVELGTTPISLPILPGFVFLFVGRALSRGARTRSAEPESADSPRPQARAPAPRPIDPRPSPSLPRFEEPKSAEMHEAAAIEEAIAEAMVQDLDIDPELTGARKTSAEMVAEARERFGKKPG